MNPNMDGIDHINIYSKGATELGRLLSNFARTPFTCEDGRFESLEGYWYWLGAPDSEPRREQLRRLWGFKAKQLGRELRGTAPASEDFQVKICRAVQAKCEQNPGILEMLKESTLPLEHYYVMNDKVIRVKLDWLTNFIANYRMYLQYPEIQFV